MLHDFPEGSAPSLWSRRPRIRSLSTMQSAFVLARNNVGQLSFIASGRPELLPLHYVYRGGRIVMRTSFGRGEYWRAVDVVRTLIPAVLTERDATPERRVLLEILPAEIPGREASTRFLPR